MSSDNISPEFFVFSNELSCGFFIAKGFYSFSFSSVSSPQDTQDATSSFKRPTSSFFDKKTRKSLKSILSDPNLYNRPNSVCELKKQINKYYFNSKMTDLHFKQKLWHLEIQVGNSPDEICDLKINHGANGRKIFSKEFKKSTAVFDLKEICSYWNTHSIYSSDRWQKPILLKLKYSRDKSNIHGNALKNTPLHTACIQSQYLVLESLLKKLKIQTIQESYNVNSQNEDGDTAMHISCDSASSGVVEMLLNNKADPLIKNKFGDSCLHRAAFGKNSFAVSMILNHVQKSQDVAEYLNCKNNQGLTAIQISAFAGDFRTVEILLAFSPLLNITDSFGNSPLHAACASSEALLTANLLISAKADVTSQNKKGITPLHIAAANGQLDLIKVLISKGADPALCTFKKSVEDEDGDIPCAYAYRYCQLGAFEYLVNLPKHDFIKKPQVEKKKKKKGPSQTLTSLLRQKIAKAKFQKKVNLENVQVEKKAFSKSENIFALQNLKVWPCVAGVKLEMLKKKLDSPN